MKIHFMKVTDETEPYLRAEYDTVREIEFEFEFDAIKIVPDDEGGNLWVWEDDSYPGLLYAASYESKADERIIVGRPSCSGKSIF